jgi:hypothetical protein
MDLRLSHTIDQRDNESPTNAYLVDMRSVSTGDCGCKGAGASGYCYNLPCGFQHRTISGGVGYRRLSPSRLTVNDTFKTTSRIWTDPSFVTPHMMTFKLCSPLTDDPFAALSDAPQDGNASH